MGDKVRAHDSFAAAATYIGYKDDADWYQSPLRDLAGVIALAYEAGETGIASELQGKLENTVKSPDELNTQEQGQLLKAAHAMLAAAGPVSIQASGVQPQGAGRFAVGRLADAKLVNTGRGAIWRTVTASGLPATPPPAVSAGLHLDKRFFSLEGAPVDPASLKQGERVIVRLTLSADGAREMQTVIDDPLPAGLEIEAVLRPADVQGAVQPQGEGEEGEGEAASGGVVQRKAATPGRFAFLGSVGEPSLQEKRDDRYVAAFTLGNNRSVTLAYVARAVTPGDFFLPGAEAKNMYRPAVNARTAPARLRVAAAP